MDAGTHTHTHARTPVSRARSSPVPGVIVSRNNGGNNIPRDQSSWHVSSEVVGYDHGRKSMDNVVISDMFLYLIMLNLLKENYVLHAIQP